MTYDKDIRLKRGDYVRVRFGPDDDWTYASVALASDTNPSSVMLSLDGPVRASAGRGLISLGLGLTVDYHQQLAVSLFGDAYEIEVQE